MMSTFDKNLLIECTSEKEAFEVLNCLQSLGERTDETYFYYGDSWKYVGFYEDSDKWTIANFSESFGSKIIQASDFLKEHSKKECPFIPGQWYKLSSGTSFVDRDWWIKFKEIDHNRGLLSEEYITNETLFKGGFFNSIESYTYTPIDVSEIQEFLPADHPDKIVNPREEFIVGKWYEYSKWYIKFSDYDGEIFHSSEEINDQKKYFKGRGSFGSFEQDPKRQLVTDLSVISDYLPDGHPDKIHSIKNSESFSETVDIRNTYIEVESQGQAAHVFDKLESLGEPVKRYLSVYIPGVWNKIQYDNNHKGWICDRQITKKRMCAKDFLKGWKTESKNPVAVVKNKPLIEPVHSVSVTLSTKKKTNKFKI